MFGLIAPRCPVDTRTKAWVERRMRWLADRLGIERMRKARVVLPSDEFFPSTYDGSEAAVRDCFVRMCGYMGVDPASVTMEIVEDLDMPGAAGLYEQRQRSNICIAHSQLASPPSLLATLAHELAHELLLKGGQLTAAESDHEQVTDLLPVFLGVGIFLANATVHSVSRTDGNMHWWSISKQGYLNSITLGYAHAVFAHVRGEHKPEWARHLRTDAFVTFKAGLKYLHRTGDTLFPPDGAAMARPSTDDLLDAIRHKSPSVRLSAIWDIAARKPLTPLLLPAIAQCLTDPDDGVQSEAVRALGAFGPAAADHLPRLAQAACDGHPAVRTAALQAIGRIRSNPVEIVSLVATILRDEKPEMVAAAAYALAAYGPDAAPALDDILNALEAAAAITAAGPMMALVTAVRAVSPDAQEKVRTAFADRDPEGLNLAISMIREQDRGRIFPHSLPNVPNVAER